MAMTSSATILLRAHQIGVVIFPPVVCAGCGELKCWFTHQQDQRWCLDCREEKLSCPTPPLAPISVNR